MDKIIFTPIGIIHTPFNKPEGTPIQPTAARNIEGTIEIYQEYHKGLLDLDGFSHIILLYQFHLMKVFSLKVKPYLDIIQHGVFATRAPARPNPIGMSIVNLVKIEKEILFIKGVDIIDGPPLLDIKPYIKEFDSYPEAKCGWYDNREINSTLSDNRFSKQ